MRSLLIGLLLALAVPVAAQPPATSSDSASIAKALHRGCANGQVLVKDTARPGEVRCATPATGGGASPAGSGTEVQARLNGTTFKAVTGSSVSGADVTLGGTISLPDGELGAPAYAFTLAAPTGIYVDRADSAVYGPSVKIATQGTPAPVDTATAVLGADGVNTNGAHQVYQTHATNDGETTPFLIATITVTGNKAIDLSALQLGRPNVVNDNKIYMTAAGVTGATNSHYVSDTGDNETDTFTIDIADATLIGNVAPPIANTTAMHALTIQGGLFGRLILDTNNDNFASGIDSLFSNTDGDNNVAIGFDALLLNIDGSHNVGIGRSVLHDNTEGSHNVGLGENALHDTTEGTNNLAIGYGASENNVTGNENIALGTSAGPTTGALDDTIAIGQGATVSAGDRAVIGQYITDAYFGSESATAIVHAAGYAAPEVAFAALPASPSVGQLANVSDSNTATWGANVAAGGANHILARWNGSNWTVVGK